MATRIQKAIVVVSVLVTLVMAAVLLVWLLVDTSHVKEELETRLNEALDMDVQIGQPLHFSLLRGANVTITDLIASREGQVVATADSARVRLALFSLLFGKVLPIELHLERPELMVKRFSPGVFNISGPGQGPDEANKLSLGRLQVSDARLSYLDQVSNLEWLFENCDLDLRNIRHAGGASEQALATLATEGKLKCRSLRQDRFVVSGLSAEILGGNGIFELEPVSATIFGGQASGRIEVDLTSGTPVIRLENRLSGFDIGAFMTMLEPDRIAAGKLELKLVLNAQGRTWQEFRGSAAGMLNLSAGELTIDGYDLDEELDGYAATQRFNLIDVGAVFLAGPLGLIVTRGYAFTGLLQGRGSSTRIDQMVSNWTFQGGVAQARDVAFRTPENRLALAGALNFKDYRFEDMRVALVDHDGCAIVNQRISGPFLEPEIEQPDFVVTIIGPILDLVEHGIQAIAGGDCEVFYTGSIPHPE